MGLSVRREALRSYIERSLQELPALPTVINKILVLTEDPNASARDIEKALAHEPAMVAKMLRVVNSAYYGLPSQISSISHAVTILGFMQVRNLALSVAAFALVRSSQPGLAKLQRSFWKHSFAVGISAPELAKRKGAAFDIRELAQVGGLLHDLGALFLFSNFSEHYRETVDAANRENIPLGVAEMQSLGISHDEVGGMIARIWKFPEPLCELIEHHHDWAHADNNLAMAAVQCADYYADVVGYPLFPLPLEPETVLAEQWPGFDENSRTNFLEWLSCKVESAESLFDTL